MRKRVVFIANSLDNAYKFQHVLSTLNVEIAAGSTAQAKKLLAPGLNASLVIVDACGQAWPYLEEIESLAESRSYPLLIIADETIIAKLQFTTLVPCDFVMSDAGHEECATRVTRLLGGSSSAEHDEVVVVDTMIINLATYQVTVARNPIDLTYLEYALLAFLAQHPNHAYSRDTLLQNVWGIDYYGGTRTVDVHVRRIRAKLGPRLAQYLETVRGVGYLWSPPQ